MRSHDPMWIPLILILMLALVCYCMYKLSIPRQRYLMRGKLKLIKGGKYEEPKRNLSTFKW